MNFMKKAPVESLKVYENNNIEIYAEGEVKYGDWSEIFYNVSADNFSIKENNKELFFIGADSERVSICLHKEDEKEVYEQVKNIIEKELN